MHIILGMLGTIVTILVLFHRLAQLGIDVGGLNPFLWNRRRKWKNMYQGNPVFKIQSPMDATAILMVATVKANGDMAKEEKNEVLSLFETKFNMSKKDAAGLLVSCVHLLGDGTEVRNNVKKFLSQSKENFTESQIDSAISLISQVAGSPEVRHQNAQDLINKVTGVLQSKAANNETW